MCENTVHWKSIPAFPGYECSTSGSVRRRDKILLQTKHTKGYRNVRLYRDGKQFTFRVHRLMMQVFVGDIAGLDVNHKNGIKHDNRLVNLEACSHAENIRHAIKTGLIQYKTGADSKLSVAVRGVHIKTGAVVEYLSQADAARAGFSQGCIQHVLTGKRKHHRGFVWSFA